MRPGVVTWVKQVDTSRLAEINLDPVWHLSTDVGIAQYEGQEKWPTWCGMSLPTDSPILSLGEVAPIRRCRPCQTAIGRELGFVV